MEILSILFGFFEEKDGEKILKIVGILFQYFSAKYRSVHPVRPSLLVMTIRYRYKLSVHLAQDSAGYQMYP